jgi:hypothetical protein
MLHTSFRLKFESGSSQVYQDCSDHLIRSHLPGRFAQTYPARNLRQPGKFEAEKIQARQWRDQALS